MTAVQAGFTRRAVIVTHDTASIVTDTPEVAQAVAAWRTEHLAMVYAVRTHEDETLPARTRRAASQRIDELDSSRAFASAQVERAVRTANPSAVEGAVRQAVRGLL